MSSSLSHFLNKEKAVFVVIPAIFGDERPRACTLVGIEVSGVWLQSDDLSGTLFRTCEVRVPPTNPNVFVPFAQIAYLVDSTATGNPAVMSHQPSKESRGQHATIKGQTKRRKRP